MKNNNVSIQINPEEMASLSPETVKAGVARRACHAKAAARWQRIAIILLIAVAVISMASTLALAKTSQSATIPEPLIIQVTDYGPWIIADDEEEMVLQAVMSAARGESELAMKAAAQCIRNAAEEKHMSVGAVLNEYRWPMDYNGPISDECKEAVTNVIDGQMAVDSVMFYCYNPNLQDGAWHEGMAFVCQIGNLRFFA